MSKFYTLTVSAISEETKNAVAVTFTIPQEYKSIFAFNPGQYITISKVINGNEIRRAYSICAPMDSDSLKIGIKKVNGGVFSVYATSQLKVGDQLQVSAPEGRFVLKPDSQQARNYLAFAAGSGITPVLSMISSVLAIEPNSKFVLVYGNKSPEEMMFASDLKSLESTYPDRFFMERVYSQANVEGALFGRIDTSTLSFIVRNKYKDFSFHSVYLCGPEAMISTIKSGLIGSGFNEKNILFELFSTPLEESHVEESLEGKAEITILLDDETTTFVMDKSKTILEQALLRGLDAPYSCQGGICSTCLAQITEGKAMMEKNSILTDEEVAEGLILTCQAHPITNTISIDYDEV
ncbi:ferredoxin--NADP reductase [Flavobacteriaceae bacterium F08102]|nr:ferredoxin--NADP reductase [Flavobacteriaceae bacterium F08102]